MTSTLAAVFSLGLALSVWAGHLLASSSANDPAHHHDPVQGSAEQGGTATSLNARPTSSPEAKRQQLREQADRLTAEGRWLPAIASYEAILAAGYGDGPLFFQLGVCYYRLGKLGKSLFYFKMAKTYLPREKRVLANIAFLAAKAEDDIQDTRPLKGYSLPLTHWEWQVAIVAVLLLMTLLVFAATKWRWHRGAIAVAVATLLLGGALLWHTHHSAANFAIVVAPEADVSSGPHPFDVTLFSLKEGTEVTVDAERVNSHGRWWHITLHDGKSGWIAARNLLTSKEVVTTKT